jgi:hypothetical protein
MKTKPEQTRLPPLALPVRQTERKYMKTPNTIEGAITEDIMRRAVQKLGKFPSTQNYNLMYEAVLEGLNFNLPAALQAPPGMDGEEFAGIHQGPPPF